MKIYLNYRQFLISGLLVFTILAQISFATSIEQMIVHTKAISLANSVTAYPPGLMSIHYNPAGLSQVREGIVFSQGFSLVHHKTSHNFTPDPDFSLQGDLFPATTDPVANTESDSEDHRLYIPFYGKGDFPVLMMPLPFGISSRQFGSRWTFAYAVYSPYVWGEETEDNGSARYQKKAAYLQHFIYAAPAVSYQVSDQFSVGLALGLGQSAMGLVTDLRMPNELTAALKAYDINIPNIDYESKVGPFDHFAELDMEVRSEKDMAPSFNIGLLWEPLSWLAIGCVYQSQVRSDLEGRFHINYTDNFQDTMDNIGKIHKVIQEVIDLDGNLDKNVKDKTDLAIKLAALSKNSESGTVILNDFTFPERVQIGLKLRPFKKLRLMCDFHWTNWISTKSYKFQFEPTDQSTLSVLQLANILGYQPDPNNPNTLIYQKEMNPTWHISFGMEYQLKECLALRMGYENRKSNTDDAYFDLLTMPDIDFYGAGLGWKLKQGVEFDLGFGYMVNSGSTIDNGISQNLNQFQSPIYSPYAGQNCKTTFESYFLSVNLTMPFETMYQKLDQVF
jgi:long-subunit fatty acid transport protein